MILCRSKGTRAGQCPQWQFWHSLGNLGWKKSIKITEKSEILTYKEKNIFRATILWARMRWIPLPSWPSLACSDLACLVLCNFHSGFLWKTFRNGGWRMSRCPVAGFKVQYLAIPRTILNMVPPDTCPYIHFLSLQITLSFSFLLLLLLTLPHVLSLPNSLHP